uniref:Uncharacterized protein n=1 Tax=Manihot esculenta TaxID=3983 RepID=A0A2C9UI94_MANES
MWNPPFMIFGKPTVYVSARLIIFFIAPGASNNFFHKHSFKCANRAGRSKLFYSYSAF